MRTDSFHRATISSVEKVCFLAWVSDNMVERNFIAAVKGVFLPGVGRKKGSGRGRKIACSPRFNSRFNDDRPGNRSMYRMHRRFRLRSDFVSFRSVFLPCII